MLQEFKAFATHGKSFEFLKHKIWGYGYLSG